MSSPEYPSIGPIDATTIRPNLTASQPPAADETDAGAWVAELTEAHRDSYPMGNINHGTPDNPNWGTFCVKCKESWPCDVSRLLERVRVVEGERDAAAMLRAVAAVTPCACSAQRARAESAEAAHAEGMAKAWDEGHRAGVMWDHTQHTDGTYSPDANPYRHDGAR